MCEVGGLKGDVRGVENGVCGKRGGEGLKWEVCGKWGGLKRDVRGVGRSLWVGAGGLR